MGLLDKP